MSDELNPEYLLYQPKPNHGHGSLEVGCHSCFEEIVNENVAQRKEIERKDAEIILLRNLLKASQIELKQLLEDCGGCDHSVGICACSLIRLIENNEEALGGAE